jgi:hypothetical protein
MRIMTTGGRLARATFALSFQVARRLRDAAFRARLTRLGMAATSTTIVSAMAEEPLGVVLARMRDAGRAFLAVPDETAEGGVALYLLTAEDAAGERET